MIESRLAATRAADPRSLLCLYSRKPEVIQVKPVSNDKSACRQRLSVTADAFVGTNLPNPEPSLPSSQAALPPRGPLRTGRS